MREESSEEEVFCEEVDISEFEFVEKIDAYRYPCPCGDYFLITKEEIDNGEEVARCPSCSLILRVIH